MTTAAQGLDRESAGHLPIDPRPLLAPMLGTGPSGMPFLTARSTARPGSTATPGKRASTRRPSTPRPSARAASQPARATRSRPIRRPTTSPITTAALLLTVDRLAVARSADAQLESAMAARLARAESPASSPRVSPPAVHPTAAPPLVPTGAVVDLHMGTSAVGSHSPSWTPDAPSPHEQAQAALRAQGPPALCSGEHPSVELWSSLSGAPAQPASSTWSLSLERFAPGQDAGSAWRREPGDRSAWDFGKSRLLPGQRFEDLGCNSEPEFYFARLTLPF